MSSGTSSRSVATGGNIGVSSAHRVQAGLLAAERTTRRRAGLSVRGADEVITAAPAAAVPPEASGAVVAVAVLEALTEVHLEEATVEAEALVEEGAGKRIQRRFIFW